MLCVVRELWTTRSRAKSRWTRYSPMSSPMDGTAGSIASLSSSVPVVGSSLMTSRMAAFAWRRRHRSRPSSLRWRGCEGHAPTSGNLAIHLCDEQDRVVRLVGKWLARSGYYRLDRWDAVEVRIDGMVVFCARGVGRSHALGVLDGRFARGDVQLAPPKLPARYVAPVRTGRWRMSPAKAELRSAWSCAQLRCSCRSGGA